MACSYTVRRNMHTCRVHYAHAMHRHITTSRDVYMLFLAFLSNVIRSANSATADLLTKEIPDFIPTRFWSLNSPNLNLVDYCTKCGQECKRRFTKGRSRTSTNCAFEMNWISASLISQSSSGARVFVRVLQPKEGDNFEHKLSPWFRMLLLLITAQPIGHLC